MASRMLRLKATFDRQATTCIEYAEQYQSHRGVLEKIAVHMERHPDWDNPRAKSKLEKLRDIYVGMCEVENQMKMHASTVEGVRDWALQTEPDLNTKWAQVIEAKKEELKRATLEDQKRSIEENLREYDRTVWNVNHRGQPMPGDDDEELVVAEVKLSIKCPVSGELLDKPVRNKECKHVYSYESILQLIGKKTRVNCPCSGCNKMVNKNSLIRDQRAERAVKEYIKQTEKRKKQSQTDIDFTQM
ncbi:hypothetical protein AAMO2058_000408900 [Amorphochlora amoebiformis]